MWAASTIPSLRPSCPPNFFSTTTTSTSAKPRQAYLTAGAVSAKFRGGPWRRRKKDDKYSSDTFSFSDDDDDEDEDGDINGGRSQVVVDPLPNKTPIISSGSNHHHHHRNLLKGQEEEEEPKPDGQLSGSDVLWALRRATAHKYNNKKKKNKEKTMTSSSSALSNQSKSNSNTQQQQQQHDDEDRNIVDYSNARAIRIKSEWTTQLDELDKRLHRLLDT